MKMNLPNKLTLLRCAMVPFFMVFAALTRFGTPQFSRVYSLIAGIIFALASITDVLDHLHHRQPDGPAGREDRPEVPP